MNKTTNIKRQFFNALKCGTGKAYLLAKENPTIDFSTYIIKGALTNYAYDGQSESSRAKYIFDLIGLSDKKEKIRKAIFKGLATEQAYTWSLTQLFDLAKIYAEAGDTTAKQAIYQRFLHNPIDGSDWVGYQEIIALDGLKGLVYIAEKFGKVMEQNPNNWQDNSIITHFQEDNPTINALEELEKVAKTNKYVRLYLNNVQKIERNRKKDNPKPKPKKINTIIDEVLNNRWLTFRIRKELKTAELHKIGEQLLQEKNKSNIEKLLNVFTYHKFPFNSDFILKLAKQRATTKNRIKEYAIDALPFLKSKTIRAFALERIPKTNNPAKFTTILCFNYKAGDYKLLNQIANKFIDEHIIESLAISYLAIFTANKTTECKEPLENLYKKMNCGIHRNKIIEMLLDNDVLSAEIRAEIEYDSYLETRELVYY